MSPMTMSAGRHVLVRGVARRQPSHVQRGFATIAESHPASSTGRHHKVVVVGGGAAGLSVSHQLLRSGKFKPREIAVVDPAQWHHYQPGWTLVGGGLKKKEELQRPLLNLVHPQIQLYRAGAATFSPKQDEVLLSDGSLLKYEQLVVAPGITLDLDAVKGLRAALQDSASGVSSIYSYDTCDRVYSSIQQTKAGNAIFTQPSGIIKCAGAPQKIMWLALDYWRKQGLYDAQNASASPLSITFATGLGAMFSVPKYSDALNRLRQERAVEGLFQHDLKAVRRNTATFVRDDGTEVEKPFDFLHVVPKMGPHDCVRQSALANDAGYVNVDSATLRHVEYSNIWSCGDAASLPTSKTAAAITGQAPVLVQNLLSAMRGESLQAAYDGYTSCPLLTEYGKVMLAEFKYAAEPHETFARVFGVDQTVPRRAFYHLKKDFFPWVYYNSMVKGTWGGPKGWLR